MTMGTLLMPRVCRHCVNSILRGTVHGNGVVVTSPKLKILGKLSFPVRTIPTQRVYSQNSGKANNPDSLLTTLKSYWNLKWFPIPASVGFAVLCYLQFRHIRKREKHKIETSQPSELVATQWQVNVLKALPLKAMSRVAGYISEVELPSWIKSSVLKAFVWKYDCRLEEAMFENISNYPTIGSFFQRTLKPSVRHIDQDHQLVSPVDGRILHLGIMEDGVVEQVKGINYSLTSFLGEDQANQLIERNGEGSGDSQIYHCIMYLAPGDCHWFHSPTEWSVQLRRHFPGELFSVSPGMARVIAGLFNYNERVVLSGQWDHGYFALVAVGATNVGSIKINFDQELQTNTKTAHQDGSFYDKLFSCSEVDGVSGMSMARGESLGGFKLGSTIVLVFEAPKTFQFCVQPGEKIKYGQPLGKIAEENSQKSSVN